MARRAAGPLTEADYKRINETLQGLENVIGDTERAVTAGLECSAEDALCKDLKSRLNKIKSVYFPGHP